MIVLGIESSCDDTGAALVDENKNILGEALQSQEEHKQYGGVVPEIAARAHLEHVDEIVDLCFRRAKLQLSDVDAIAASAGPGLIGGVVVGVMTAKSLALALNKPFIALNHLEAHALCARIADDIQFPYLLLLVSGGHCQILVVKNVGEYERLGTTIDDAAGEAFDKVAKMLGLGYPGGPMIEKLAQMGNETRFSLPQPLINSQDCNLSFSGLKTAVRKLIESYCDDGKIDCSVLPKQDINDICACFQYTVTRCLSKKLERAIAYFKQKYPQGKHLVVSGGVASNTYLRSNLHDLSQKHGLEFAAPPIKFCTDNGVMVAWAGLERFRLNMLSGLDFKPRPRWPLDENAPKAAGAGAVKA